MEEDWKYLIILDACRFDYFSQMYPRFLTGRLERRLSRASCTFEFLRTTFTRKYPETVYVSALPYVSSHGSVAGFDASALFSRVIDGWDLCWDDQAGTVPPWRLRQLAGVQIAKHPSKRFIIHFLQPHTPYLQQGIVGFPRPKVGGSSPAPLSWKPNTGPQLVLSRFQGVCTMLRFDILGLEVGRLLGFPPASPMDQARRSLGAVGLRAAYANNLALVLEQCSKLVKLLRGKIVITSDHGELLGEGGRYGHPCKSKSDLLRAVPWFSYESPT
jgi:hypothetical protein